MLDLPLYILAGGRSSRFGSDKARAVREGRALIVAVAEALSPRASSVTAVADVAGKYDDLGITTIADVTREQGPLGGLAAALRHRASRGPGWLLLATCDLLSPRVEWVDALTSVALPPCRAAVFFGERLEPLFGIYHTSLEPHLDATLTRGETAAWRFVSSIPATVLPLPDGLPRLPQANTRDDLSRSSAAR